MARKIENYSVPELVAGFSNKWRVPIIELGESLEFYPYITFDGGEGYRIWFKGAVNKFSVEKLSKKVLINPDEYLGLYQLKQLEEAQRGDFHHEV